MSDQPPVHIGTSSWLFDAWRGVFYPDKLPKSQQLVYYATQFPTVEVNTSFYAIPSPSTLINWVESVPAGFSERVKAKLARVVYRRNIHTLAEEEALGLEANAIGQVELVLQSELPVLPFAQSRALGAMILVDQASHRTAGAVLVAG